MSARFRALLARLLPLCLVIGLSLAAPTHAWGGDDNNQGNEDQGNSGPAIPEPSALLAMGAGLLVVGSYLRSRIRTRR